jgi:DNA-binding response OmpR family regulator
VKVAAVITDLMLFSRIASAAGAAGATLTRVDEPSGLTPGHDLVLVDWSSPDATWIEALRTMRDAGARVILFGPHTDLEAHAAAREARLGPMWARSRLVRALPTLLA